MAIMRKRKVKKKKGIQGRALVVKNLGHNTHIFNKQKSCKKRKKDILKCTHTTFSFGIIQLQPQTVTL